MVKIKFCGMTDLDGCLAAADLGVDYVGFVFYRKSARYVSPDRVRSITERLGGRVKTVGVFVEETGEEVEEMLRECGLDLAQVYRPTDIKETISVYRIKDRVPPVEPEGLVLFDAYTESFGGSGRSFDFEMLKGHEALPRAFVAGGIGEDNVDRVLRLGPYGVDLASAVEERPGRKERRKMESFVKKVRSFAL